MRVRRGRELARCCLVARPTLADMSGREHGEAYTPGFGVDVQRMLSSRAAESRAAWFVEALRPGMRVLDVGCGPGSITLGLGRAVLPGGEVVGVDGDPGQVSLSREVAVAGGVTNARFEVACAYALPFADAAFDAVFSHALFEHLARPIEAARELVRVVRQGGIVGVASSDWSAARIEPRTADVDLALTWHLRLRRSAGGDPNAGRNLPSIVATAGLVDYAVHELAHEDLTYGGYGAYIADLLERAAGGASDTDRSELIPAAEAARRWAGQRGNVTQAWVAVLARRP